MRRIGDWPMGRVARVLCAGVVSAALGGVAHAQDEEPELQVIEVKEVDNKPAIWGMITMGLLIAMAVGANAIPSRRGHQD